MQYFVYSSTWISHFSRKSSCGFCRASCKTMWTSLHNVIPHTWPTTARKFMDDTVFKVPTLPVSYQLKEFPWNVCGNFIASECLIFFRKASQHSSHFPEHSSFYLQLKERLINAHHFIFFNGWINVYRLTANNSKCMGLVQFIKNRVYLKPRRTLWILCVTGTQALVSTSF